MIIATNNKGKVQELKSIFHYDTIFSLREKGIDIDIEEGTESSFENAKKKAIEVFHIANEATIADDTGIYIHALNDFPGVLSHRFLGEEATDDDRNNYLLEKLKDCEDRSASVICYIVYYNGKKTVCGVGKLEGIIAKERRGQNGFGFDDIFELPNGKTLAELTIEEKNKISARYLAIIDLKKQLEEIEKQRNEKDEKKSGTGFICNER